MKEGSKECIYITHKGKRLVNNLVDFEYKQIEKETEYSEPISEIVKVVKSSTWVKCPKCGLNYIHEGEECCVECKNKKI